MVSMKRREFITLLGGSALAQCLAIRPGLAQGVGPRPAHVGFISGVDAAAAADFLKALRDGLSMQGYVEPSTLKIEQLFANNDLERIPALLEELERQRVNVIVTHAAATYGVVKGRRTIPAVYEFSADPITLGIAKDLAHPLDNATGITLMSVEMNGKRLELLHEIAPEIRRVAVLANPLHPGVQRERADFEAKAQQLGIEVSFFPTPNRAELDRALDLMAGNTPQALVAFSDAFVVENRNYIINFAMSRHLPVVSGWAVMAESGALCTYGPRLVESYRRVAYYVDRILKGAKPAELPIEQPTIFELVINLNSAKTLGQTIPPVVLVRADRVIE
jgi:putative ABC transport system substrate-binding protein